MYLYIASNGYAIARDVCHHQLGELNEYLYNKVSLQLTLFLMI